MPAPRWDVTSSSTAKQNVKYLTCFYPGKSRGAGFSFQAIHPSAKLSLPLRVGQEARGEKRVLWVSVAFFFLEDRPPSPGCGTQPGVRMLKRAQMDTFLIYWQTFQLEYLHEKPCNNLIAKAKCGKFPWVWILTKMLIEEANIRTIKRVSKITGDHLVS